MVRIAKQKVAFIFSAGSRVCSKTNLSANIFCVDNHIVCAKNALCVRVCWDTRKCKYLLWQNFWTYIETFMHKGCTYKKCLHVQILVHVRNFCVCKMLFQTVSCTYQKTLSRVYFFEFVHLAFRSAHTPLALLGSLLGLGTACNCMTRAVHHDP